jgi:hypothetical protein
MMGCGIKNAQVGWAVIEHFKPVGRIKKKCGETVHKIHSLYVCQERSNVYM